MSERKEEAASGPQYVWVINSYPGNVIMRYELVAATPNTVRYRCRGHVTSMNRVSEHSAAYLSEADAIAAFEKWAAAKIEWHRDGLARLEAMKPVIEVNDTGVTP